MGFGLLGKGRRRGLGIRRGMSTSRFNDSRFSLQPLEKRLRKARAGQGTPSEVTHMMTLMVRVGARRGALISLPAPLAKSKHLSTGLYNP